MGLQELMIRGRHIFAAAPDRLKVFELVNGKRTTREIANLTNRHVNNIRRDLNLMADAGLIMPVTHRGEVVKKDGFPLFDKLPLARTLPLRHFQATSRLPVRQTASSAPRTSRPPRRASAKPLPVPSEGDILDIARDGEDQTHEFKGQGTDVRKVTREVGAMLNTSQGGLVLYGIDDDGNIEGSDLSRQEMDQRLQNSVKNSVSPAATVRVASVTVLGSDILVVIVPPWNCRSVYQFDEKILIRKGTNVFGAKPEEVKQLHDGKPVV
jgi:predicted HTH transcriptional regulator